MIDKSQYRLLSSEHLDEFEGYDRVVAQNHVANCGCIIVSPEFGDPIDDEYMLEEIYSQIQGTTMFENKRKQALLEKRIGTALSESIYSKLHAERLDKLYECYEKLQEAYYQFGLKYSWYIKNKQEIDEFIANGGPFVGGYRKMLDQKVIPFAQRIFKKK